MKVSSVAIDTLVPYPGNPRRGDVEVIKESLSAHGQYAPLVVQQSTNTILVGNHRWQAARDLGWKKIDVVALDIDDEQARRIIAVDNATSDRATYDFIELENLLASFDGDLEGTGYSLDDLEEINKRAIESITGDDDDDELPDQSGRSELLNNADLLEKEPEHKTKQGDVWALGAHVLVVVQPHKDWAKYVGYLEDSDRDLLLTYPDIYITATDVAKEKRLVMVQPNVMMAGYMLDAHASMFGSDTVEAL